MKQNPQTGDGDRTDGAGAVEIEASMKELCIRFGKETPYHDDTSRVKIYDAASTEHFAL